MKGNTIAVLLAFAIPYRMGDAAQFEYATLLGQPTTVRISDKRWSIFYFMALAIA